MKPSGRSRVSDEPSEVPERPGGRSGSLVLYAAAGAAAARPHVVDPAGNLETERTRHPNKETARAG